MSWQNRIRSRLKLTSPSGQVFEAFWRGDDLEVAKSLGRFKFPNLDGEKVQDLGLEALAVPLTFYFEGPDHDTTARAFRKALAEVGPWTIIHPVEGQIRLQPATAKFRIDPVGSANVTEISSTWLEPLEDAPAAVADAAGSIDAAVSALSQATASQLAAAKTTAVADVAAIASKTKSAIAKAKKALVSASARVNRIQSQIQSTLRSTPMDILSLAGEIVELIQSPGQVAGGVASQVKTLAAFGASVLDGLSDLAPSSKSLNQVLLAEAFASATLGAMAGAIQATPPETRAEVLAAMTAVRSYFADMTSGLDAAGAVFRGQKIEDQYFSQSAAYPAALVLVGHLSRYLLELLFSLKTETRIVLNRRRATFEVAIKEYNATAATADDVYSFLVATNRLTGLEVLWLPAGRELVIYG